MIGFLCVSFQGLIELELQYNEICDAGAKAIGRGLAQNTVS